MNDNPENALLTACAAAEAATVAHQAAAEADALPVRLAALLEREREAVRAVTASPALTAAELAAKAAALAGFAAATAGSLPDPMMIALSLSIAQDAIALGKMWTNETEAFCLQLSEG